MTYKDELIEHFKDGLLIAVKYSVIVFIIVYAFAFLWDTRTRALSGEQAALAIREYQEKGILPKFPITDSSNTNQKR